MVAIAAFLFLFLAASTASAQSAYVGGSLLADVVRFSGSSTDTVVGNGEAIGGAIRVGAPLGTQWGVDLEFARSAEIESTPDVRILADLFGGSVFAPAIFPPPEISIRGQLSTLATTVWWRHDIGERFDLVYLGGVSFSRTKREARVNFGPLPLPASLGGVILPTSLFAQDSVSYDAGVIVGLDGRVAMTEHLRLVPGVRLLTVPDGWVARPAVGLQWMF